MRAEGGRRRATRRAACAAVAMSPTGRGRARIAMEGKRHVECWDYKNGRLPGSVFESSFYQRQDSESFVTPRRARAGRVRVRGLRASNIHFTKCSRKRKGVAKRTNEHSACSMMEARESSKERTVKPSASVIQWLANKRRRKTSICSTVQISGQESMREFLDTRSLVPRFFVL